MNITPISQLLSIILLIIIFTIGGYSTGYQVGFIDRKHNSPQYLDLPEEIGLVKTGTIMVRKIVKDTIYLEFFHDYPGQWKEDLIFIIK